MADVDPFEDDPFGDSDQAFNQARRQMALAAEESFRRVAKVQSGSRATRFEISGAERPRESDTPFEVAEEDRPQRPTPFKVRGEERPSTQFEIEGEERPGEPLDAEFEKANRAFLQRRLSRPDVWKDAGEDQGGQRTDATGIGGNESATVLGELRDHAREIKEILQQIKEGLPLVGTYGQ